MQADHLAIPNTTAQWGQATKKAAEQLGQAARSKMTAGPKYYTAIKSGANLEQAKSMQPQPRAVPGPYSAYAVQRSAHASAIVCPKQLLVLLL